MEEEMLEKRYEEAMKVINETSLPLFVEDTFEDIFLAYKQDEKVIKEMAKYIEDTADMDSKFGYDICNKENCYADKYILGHCKKCINCIIDHFRKKCE